jgi:DNA-binding NarL/FixJ family response regulator
MTAALHCSDPDVRHASTMRRLVIVADSSLVVEAIRIGFRKSGEFRLVGYANGRTTTAGAILSAAPDVILLDDMGRSSRALELLRALRAEDQDVAVFVLSMQIDSEWLGRAFEAGATAVIAKATRPTALVTLVRETLSGHIVHRPAPDPPAASCDAIAESSLPLTARELEILRLVASGSTNGAIACQLWVTEQTVKFHLRNIYRKLDVANRTEASHLAHVKGLLGPSVAAIRTERHLTVA